MKRFVCILLACSAMAISATAKAQSILFDFDNLPANSGLPIDDTVGGVTAHLTGTGSGFSIQQAGVLGFTPAGFAGNCIYPDSVYGADLGITFSKDLSDISIMYSPEEYGCDSSATMRITAYEDGVLVGTRTTTAPNPGTWPTGVLSFSSIKPFDSVVIHYDKGPVTGGDWGPVFMADNMRVTVNAYPQAYPDTYSLPLNTSLTVPAATGVLANDEGPAATAVLVASPTHGTLTLFTDGGFSYKPDSGFVGTDSFTYKGLANGLSGNVAKVTILTQPVLSGLSLSSSAVLSGTKINGTVTLSQPSPVGGTVVALSSNLAGVTLPVQVNVAASKTTGSFSIATGTVSTATAGLISASLNRMRKTAPLTIYPTSSLVGISSNVTSLVGGSRATCTVTLSAPVPVGYQTVALSSGSPFLTVPATVRISAGQTSATFTVSSLPVSTSASGAVSASFGSTKKTVTLLVTIPPLTSLRVLSSSVAGGTSTTGTITLKAAAGPFGAVVNLSSSNPAASVPSTVTVPAGATTATFTVVTTMVARSTPVTLTATYGPSTVTASLTVH